MMLIIYYFGFNRMIINSILFVDNIGDHLQN